MLIDQLGYVVFSVSDLVAWESFGTDVLGLGVSGRFEGGAFSLRLDERLHRIFVEPGRDDDLVAVGWQVADEAALAGAEARLTAAGVSVERGSSDLAAARGVSACLCFSDPAGMRTEIFCGPEMADGPFHSPQVDSGFVASDLGLGHVVLGTADVPSVRDFYVDVMGFRLSDRIVTEIFGHAVDVTFLHTNARHHSLALGGAVGKRIHHLMLEVGRIDDVGAAFDRVLRAGLPIANTIGRHPNDQMVSFYAFTPSGFQFEFGCNGRLVDDATWQTTTYDRISDWGHHSPIVFKPRKTQD